MENQRHLEHPTRPLQGKGLTYHLVGWTIFLLYEIILVNFMNGLKTTENMWWALVIPYIINISYFYLHAWFLWRVLQFSHTIAGRLALLVPGVLVEIFLYLLLMTINNWAFLSKGESLWEYFFGFGSQYYVRHTWRGIYFMLFSTAYWYTRRFFMSIQQLRETEARNFRQQQEKAEMEVQLVKTRNAFLQSQVNPHLIFNALNFIQNEVREASPEAAESVITLADLMRYSLSGTKEDGTVLLEEELEQIGNLIRINQSRFSNRLHLRMRVNGDVENVHIMPLTLIPIVENLFKYADLTNEDEPATITARVTSNQLFFETYNRKKTTVQYKTTGIGISNLRQRLEARYSNRFSLEASDLDTHYRVTLQITL